MAFHLTREERETIILFNEAEQNCELYTYNKTLQRRLDSLCTKFPDDFFLKSEENFGGCTSKTYGFDKKYISVRAPRYLSDEQKEVAAERMRNIRKRQG